MSDVACAAETFVPPATTGVVWTASDRPPQR